MKTRTRIRTPLWTLAALVLAAALVVPPARAELAKWDQARVTGIANDLAKAVKHLRSVTRKEPPATLGQAGRVAFYQFQDELGSIESSSRRLTKALQDGKGREQTYPTYQRMMASVRNAAEEARRANVSENVLNAIAPCSDALRRLRPYYEEEPPPPEPQ